IFGPTSSNSTPAARRNRIEQRNRGAGRHDSIGMIDQEGPFMIKDIVVNLGLGAQDPAGTYAISVAEKFEAHLVGIAVSYEPVIPGTVMGGVPPDVIEGQRFESNMRSYGTIARFEQAAKREGVSMGSRLITTSLADSSDEVVM